ncbi:redox-regulated ATPase YchF [Candidatus Saccharibacteria bacterium]|nr:redox-regulated ATPase YchF [Candidatus Saccharibacteria bacterium]
MSLSIGIVGLPNVGKSTLFNALTGGDILAANYPFATIEPNTGMVAVPDDRLLALEKLYNAQKVIPATVTFVDIAGLVAGASKGEGLGNQFLANIRTCDAIVHVVRAFEDSSVLRHDTAPTNPRDDIDVINTELVLADLQTVEKRLPRLDKEARGNPKLQPNVAFLQEVRQVLDAGTPINASPSITSNELCDWLQKELQLLTLKPVIYAFNVSEDELTDQKTLSELQNLVAPARSLFVCAKLEEELKGLDATEAAELLESYGVQERGLVQLIHATYDTLGLQSYLTAGEKEVRAWTIHKGYTAPQAAGVIHGDFEKGFIAAQIISYPDLIAAGSEQAAKAAGKIRTEGKDYAMQPDDVVEFRFNVTK